MKPTRYDKLSPCVRAVVDTIAQVYGVKAPRMMELRKQSRVAFARSVALYICRAELDMGWLELEEEFGGSSPGIMAAVGRVAKLLTACDVRTLAGVCAGERVAERFNGIAEAAE